MSLSVQMLAGSTFLPCAQFISHCTSETQRQFSLRSKSPREPEAVELCVTHPKLPQLVGAFASLQT